MPKRSQRQYLQDILDAMIAAEQFIDGVTFEELEENLEKQYALQRAFEIIGEATKQLDSNLRGAHPEVPWSDMAGMRDILIHGYFAIHLEIVWDAVHKEFPRDKKNIRRILAQLPPED